MYSGVDQSKTEFRRKWNLEEFERKAQERLGKRKRDEKTDEDEQDKASDHGSGSDNDIKNDKKKKENKSKKPKELLKARDYKVDLESKIGKSVVINRAGTSNQGGGYFCEICDCTLKDSVSYLDHINGKKHQQNLGFSMKVKRSTIDDVKARFQYNLNKKDEEKKAYNIEEKMLELKEEEERIKEYRKEKRKEKKDKKNKRKKHGKNVENEQDGDIDNEQCLDDQMAEFMGFGSFGSSKKK